RRDAAVLGRAEAGEQVQCRLRRLGWRRLDPLERERLASPCEDVEEWSREIDAANLRLAPWTEVELLVPEAHHVPRSRASCASGPLVGGILRDPLRLQAIDALVRVEPED